jgi:UDP-N-acetylglucosamine 2-epimerase (non-hydrolysing)
MKEILMSKLDKINSSKILQELKLKKNKYFIVSVHREENVDHPENLRKVVTCLEKLYDEYKLPVIVSTHPRTRNRLEKLNLNVVDKDIRFLKPFGFFDYNKLQINAFCAISDSGTISEESAILNFPAVTIRNSLERPEALDAGSIIMTGLNPDVLLNAVQVVIAEPMLFKKREVPFEYEIENTSLRVTKFIIGTAKLTHRWRNMDEFSRYDWQK